MRLRLQMLVGFCLYAVSGGILAGHESSAPWGLYCEILPEVNAKPTGVQE